MTDIFLLNFIFCRALQINQYWSIDTECLIKKVAIRLYSICLIREFRGSLLSKKMMMESKLAINYFQMRLPLSLVFLGHNRVIVFL